MLIQTSSSKPTPKTNLTNTMYVSTYEDYGPYYGPLKDIHEVHDLKSLIFWVRESMEQKRQYIGVFDGEGTCKGIWQLEVDAEYGEGECYDELYVVGYAYDLLRDSESWYFKNALSCLSTK